MLLAIFPANIYMAAQPESFPGITAWVLWLRLQLQFVLIGLVLWSSQKNAFLPVCPRKRRAGKAETSGHSRNAGARPATPRHSGFQGTAPVLSNRRFASRVA